MNYAMGLFAIVAAFSLAACGGGAGGGEVGGVATVVVPASPELDGSVFAPGNPGTGSSPGFIQLGDQSNNAATKGVAGFSLLAIPADAEIVKAELAMYQQVVLGAPYTGLGNMILDLVNLGGAVDQADYNSPAILANVGVLSNSPALELKTADVTQAVRAARAQGLATADFRIYFQQLTDNDASVDRAFLNDSADTAGGKPVPTLTIEYRQ